jgi:hypothetical protein
MIQRDPMDHCPYNDTDCPKVNEIKEDIDNLNIAVSNLLKIVYIIVGVCVAELGIVLI